LIARLHGQGHRDADRQTIRVVHLELRGTLLGPTSPAVGVSEGPGAVGAGLWATEHDGTPVVRTQDGSGGP
jgi:hypothetical protein